MGDICRLKETVADPDRASRRTSKTLGGELEMVEQRREKNKRNNQDIEKIYFLY